MAQWCTFVSDLHHFSRRSRTSVYERTLREALETSDRVVLGGDIFDFKWSTLPSHRATVDAAIEWLADLVQLYPHCQIDYVLGNHDFDEKLMEHLTELAGTMPRFAWHPYVMQLGESLFLHGDVADRRIDHHRLEQVRHAWKTHRRPHPIRHDLYDWAVKFRLHRVPSMVLHRPVVVAQRLLHYIDRHPELSRESIRRIYFGHTHAAIDGLEWEGIRFYNGGAPMPGLKFKPIRFQL